MLKKVIRLLTRLAFLATIAVVGRAALKRWIDGPEPRPSGDGGWAPVNEAPRVAPPANRGQARGTDRPGPAIAAEPAGASPAEAPEAVDASPAGAPAEAAGAAGASPAEAPEAVDASPAGAPEAATSGAAGASPAGAPPIGSTAQPASGRGRPDRPLRAERSQRPDRPLRADRPLKANRNAGGGGSRGAAAGAGKKTAGSGARPAGRSQPVAASGGSGSSGSWVSPDESGAAPSSHPVKVKVSSGIYREPGSSGYDRTRPDRCYASAEAAEADGFVRAKR